jgi:hypothetical protein
MCSGICTTEKKGFPTEKLMCFLFQVIDLRFFHKIFYFTTVAGSESESKSELFSYSYSDPAKIFGFFRIRIHNAAARATKDK